MLRHIADLFALDLNVEDVVRVVRDDEVVGAALERALQPGAVAAVHKSRAVLLVAEEREVAPLRLGAPPDAVGGVDPAPARRDSAVARRSICRATNYLEMEQETPAKRAAATLTLLAPFFAVALLHRVLLLADGRRDPRRRDPRAGRGDPRDRRLDEPLPAHRVHGS